MSLFTTFNGFLESSFFANAVNFDGTNDFLEKLTNFSSVSDGKVLTLSFWVNINTIGGSFADFIFLGDIGVRNNLLLRFNQSDKELVFTLADNTGTAISFTSNAVFTLGSWNHCVCILSGITRSNVPMLLLRSIIGDVIDQFNGEVSSSTPFSCLNKVVVSSVNLGNSVAL